ncbi:hypothetical protein G6F50_013878 [Rhizopus delemar]|uniref:Uncharacterized protein n=1 Tax=Rhizopus delemar TaxID=936053 RepID=A0A9P6YBR7_9FUNG|nr:hypothetical protein G6F50_013878 [Rhizopus delemar]
MPVGQYDFVLAGRELAALHRFAQKAGRLPAPLFGQRGARALGMHGHAAFKQRHGIQAPQHDMRVRQGDRRAAPVVRDRARHGAGALRAYLQRAGIVDTRDAAAARADHMDVHHRRLHGIARHVAMRGEQRAAITHQRHVRAGAAHVEGNQVQAADGAPHGGRAHHARRRPGQAGPYRILAHGGDRHQAAVGMHCRGGYPYTHALHRADQVAHVGSHARADIGVQGGCRHAFADTPPGCRACGVRGCRCGSCA